MQWSLNMQYDSLDIVIGTVFSRAKYSDELTPFGATVETQHMWENKKKW